MKNLICGLRRTLLAPLLLLASLCVPMQAFAASCSACYWSGYQTGYASACSECAAVFQQLTQLINQSTQSINTNIDGTRTTLSEKIDSATNAIVSAIEKQSAAEKELKQSELNYDAARDAKEAAADSQDMFLAPGADIMDPSVAANACATAATATAATTAANNAALTARALAAADSRKRLYTSNSSALLQQELRTYRDNFCSDEAARRGLCGANGSTNVPKQLQDEDTNAGALLAPTSGRTYSDDESKAARQYITNVIGQIPQEALPIMLEKTPAGQRFVLEQRAMASAQSMASFSLNTIFANNSAENSASAAASEKVSLVGLMRKFVEDRFGNPQYRDQIGTMNEVGLLRQVAENLAFQNWMDYYGYLQGERTEGLLATTLALNVRDRTEQRLGALRAQAANLSR